MPSPTGQTFASWDVDPPPLSVAQTRVGARLGSCYVHREALGQEEGSGEADPGQNLVWPHQLEIRHVYTEMITALVTGKVTDEAKKFSNGA